MHSKIRNEIDEWWLRRLLGQKASAHPVFGNDIQVDVDNGVVTLSGTVRSPEEAQELERQASGIDTVKTVVNRLQVLETDSKYHMQTVVGVYGDCDDAKLACQAAESWTIHGERTATLLTDPSTAREQLHHAAQAAHVPEDAVADFGRALEAGKALLLARVPEDDALRVISELEGSRAEKVVTLPPEPDALEAD